MDFFGIGFGELLLILIVVLIVFGPGKLPEIGRNIGRLTRNLKKMSSDFTTAMNDEIDLEETKDKRTHLKSGNSHKNISESTTTGGDADKPVNGPDDSKT
jgi:sec-independent protein translocase protein TatA